MTVEQGLRLNVLGGLDVWRERQDQEAEQLPQPPGGLSAWVCAVLAVSGPLTRERLAELLWPQSDPAAARNALRNRIHHLSTSAYAPGLNLGLQLEWTAHSDVGHFRALLQASDWAGAVRTYGGPLLQGAPFPPRQDLSDWLDMERGALEAELLQTLWKALADPALSATEVLELLRHAHTAAPDRSEITGELVRHLLRRGDRRAARQLLDAAQQHLRAHWDEPPPPELIALQAEAGRVDSSAGPPQDLPSFLTSFVGRTRERAQLMAGLLHPDPARRLFTLTGPGGSGKTRLAVHLAAELWERVAPDIRFVPLAAERGEVGLHAALLRALGGPVDSPQEEREALIIQLLGDQDMLLILDNFESLIGAAEVLPRLLQAVPGLRLLVTSRERLGFQAEWVLRLGGLQAEPLPEDEPNDATLLFEERARRVAADFELRAHLQPVAQIVRRCEGLPLAIELAAAQCAAYPVSEVAARLERHWDSLGEGQLLRDLPVRHRSLRAAFETAFSALPAALQNLCAQLANFRTPFSASDAGEVVATDWSGSDLTALEWRSLLIGLPGERFGWHESLREYALERQPDPSVQRGRHARWVLGWAENLAPQLSGPQQAEVLSQVAIRLPDVQDALEELIVTSVPLALRLAVALHWYWYVRGPRAVGLEQLERALDAAQGAPLPECTAARRAAGVLAAQLGRPAVAAAHHQQALILAETHGQVREEAEVRHWQGVLRRDLGDLSPASADLERAAALWAQLGDLGGAARTLNDQGILLYMRGEREQARTAFQRSLDLKERVGDVQGVAYALNNLAAFADSPEEDLALQRRSLDLKEQLGDLRGLVTGYGNTGDVLLGLGRVQEAAVALTRSVAALEQLRDPSLEGLVLLYVAELALLSGHPQVAAGLAGFLRRLRPPYQLRIQSLKRLACLETALQDNALHAGPGLPAGEDAVVLAKRFLNVVVAHER